MPGILERERPGSGENCRRDCPGSASDFPPPSSRFRVLGQPRLNSRKTETLTQRRLLDKHKSLPVCFFFFSLVPHVQSYPTSQRTN